MARSLFVLCAVLLAAGCMDSLEKQVQKDPNSNIGKFTQDIGEFDPTAKAKVSDSKVHITNPITGPIEARGPMLEQTAKLQIQHTLNIYNATEGKYPESHEEFMEKIIKPNGIKLPVLPGGAKYQYDVANHELVVIQAAAEDAPPAAPAP
ncbi:MAG: hypothetical protein SFV23_13105 [Planctomycetaceae bacterium]|nr:hypothetical protein [Planctomycetaceae bacterium]